MTSAMSRLQAHWVYGGAIAGVLLLALAPLLMAGLTPAGGLVYLGLAAYMLHQYEEHDNDRFRRFVNEVVCGGREGLTVASVFVINIFGVWGVLALCLWLTERLDPGWALIAGWFLVVNGAAHLVQGLVLRRTNPGLWTGIVLFLPLGVWTLGTVWPQSDTVQRILSLLLILGLHGLIVRSLRKAMP